MPMPVDRGLFRVCAKSGRIVGFSSRLRALNLLLPALGAVAALWWVIRVLPKPSRAAYPCQRVAGGLAAGFVGYVVALPLAVIAFRKARRLLWQARFVLAAVCVLAGLVAGAFGLSTVAREASAWTPQDPPNAPVGVGKGIFPGRVAWIRDTNATPWNGTTGYWWHEGTGINTQALARMMSRCLRGVTGEGGDAQSWEAIFRQYNRTHGRGDVGYRTNEALAIKINLNNTYGGYTDADGDIDQSPSAIRSLLIQLTAKAGVPQSLITVYDASPNGNNRAIPDRIYTPLHAEFPGVHWVDCRGLNGREAPGWVTASMSYSATNAACGTKLPACVVNATYLINFALLKGHEFSGVTLCGKNHFGTIQYPNQDHSKYVSSYAQPMGSYSGYVDLMGSTNLGGKTVLYIVDGLYGMRTNVKDPTVAVDSWTNVFGGGWSSSYFMSLDPVAIDSVGLDFLVAEYGDKLGYSAAYKLGAVTNCDNYLREAARGTNAVSGAYAPHGVAVGSLGVFEHWNNATQKQYSRNLGATNGIELLSLHLATPLSVVLVAPTNGASFEAGTNVLLEAETATNLASIANVAFYGNGMWLGAASNSPYAFGWTNVPYGIWTLTAVATDLDGYAATSAPVTVTSVLHGISIALTNPPAGTVVAEGSNLTLGSAAFAESGVQTVAFFAGATLVGSDASPPYQTIWSNVPAGAWSLRATLTDSNSLTITSAVVNVTVARTIGVGVTAPTSGYTYVEGATFALAATASCPFSVMQRVDFRANGSVLGTATSVPFLCIWTNAGAGAQAIVAVATDVDGFAATSSPVVVTGRPANIAIVGDLLVDVRALDAKGGGITNWVNRGLLGGSFARVGSPAYTSNAVGSGLPAVQFNGTTDAFVGPNSVADIDGASDRTIEAWVHNPAIGTEETLLEIGHRNTGGRNCAFNYGNSLVWGACAQADAAHDVGWNQTTNIPAAGAWHHFVYTYGGGTTCLFYVDGTLRVTKNMTTALNIFAGEPILLGAQRGNTANLAPSLYWFSGYLNSVRVHGGVLSPAAVASNFAAGPFVGTGPVVLSAQPASQTVFEHTLATLSAAASGLGPLVWQWYRDGAAIPAATNSSYTLLDARCVDSGARFQAVVANPLGVATTAVATLTVEVPGAFLTHRYSFASNANDSAGTAHGTLFGTASISNGSLVLPGVNGAYCDLPGGGIAVRNYAAVTFEAWASFGVNANWPRLFDQGSTTNNGGIKGQYDLYFCPKSGSSDYRLTIMDPQPTERIVNKAGNLDNRTNLHIVCVLDPRNGFMAVYTNGSLAASRNDLVSLSSVDTNLFYLGRSLFAADAWLNGSIDEFRIYRTALSADAIARNYQSGSDSALPAGPVRISAEPQSAGVMEFESAVLNVGAIGEGPFAYQWFRDGQAVSGATNATFNFAGALLGDSGAQFVCIVSNTHDGSGWVVTSAVATVAVAINTNLPVPLLAAQSNGVFSVVFRTTPGRSYWIEESDSVMVPVWSNCGPVEVATGSVRVMLESITGATHRFYRPVLAP